MKRVCVFCGSRDGERAEYLATARETGRLLAERGIGLVYGGGGRGMMGAVADGALAAGGEAIGVIPDGLFVREGLHAGLTETRLVANLLERKQLMAELSDAFISLPGGLGTCDELFEMWTWTQLSIHAKPNAIVNVAGYFDRLVDFVEHMCTEGYVSPRAARILHVANTPGEALAKLDQAGAGPGVDP